MYIVQKFLTQDSAVLQPVELGIQFLYSANGQNVFCREHEKMNKTKHFSKFWSQFDEATDIIQNTISR